MGGVRMTRYTNRNEKNVRDIIYFERSFLLTVRI